MAITWGSWDKRSGNGMRIGYDVSRSKVSSTSSNVKFTIKIYTQNQYRYSDNQTITLGGVLSGTVNYNNSQAANGIKLRATRTYTHTYTDYGQTHTRTASAKVGGAYNGSAPSVSIRLSVPARPVQAPAAPTGLTVAGAPGDTITLNWTNHHTGTAPVNSVTVRRRILTGSTWSVSADVTLPGRPTSYTLTSATANRIYEFRVRANNGSGSSAFTAPSTAATTPAAPTEVTSAVEPIGGNIGTSWGWDGPADAGYRFEVERSVNGGAWASVATNLPAEARSWADGTPGVGANQYRVRVTHTTLASAWTTGNTISTVAPPLAPTIIFPNNDTVDGTRPFTVRWKHNHGGDGATQTAMQGELRLMTEPPTPWHLMLDLESPDEFWESPGDGNNDADVPFEMRIRTRGVPAEGFGPWATTQFTASTTPVVTIAPDAPADTVVDLPIVAEWAYQQDEDSPQTQWQADVFLDDGEGGIAEIVASYSGISDASAVTIDAPLFNETDYGIQVRARSAAGLWSDWATRLFTIDLLPPAEPDVDAQFDHTIGATILTIEPVEPDPAETVATTAFEVQRQIDDGGWHTIVTQIDVNGLEPVTLVDPLPTLNGTNAYRLLLTGSNDMRATTEPAIVVTGSDGEGFLFVNYGPGFQTLVRARHDTNAATSTERVAETKRMLGREFPILLTGDGRQQDKTVAARLLPDEFDGHGTPDSTPDDWDTAAWEAEIVAYRDPSGARIFGHLTGLTHALANANTYTLSFKVDRTDYFEGATTATMEVPDDED